MPEKRKAASALSDFLGVLSHPDRIRIVEELRSGQLEVREMRERLDIPPSRLSQHLTLLKAQNLIGENRDGRKVVYVLLEPGLAEWLLEGLIFVRHGAERAIEVGQAAARATQMWSHPDEL